MIRAEKRIMEHPAQRHRTGASFKAFYFGQKTSKNGWQGLCSFIILLDDLREKIKQGHCWPCSFRLESYFCMFQGVIKSGWAITLATCGVARTRENNTNVYNVKNFIIKKQSNIIKLEALGQKNPWKGVSFPRVNRGLKGEWNGNIPCCLKIYILLQCRMSSTFSWPTIKRVFIWNSYTRIEHKQNEASLY